MLAPYFEAGGPILWAVLAAWVVVLAGVLDRLLYAAGRLARRPERRVTALVALGRLDDARAHLERERTLAERGLARIDSVSQLATSIGLFGTVVGIAHSFFARGTATGLAAPDVLTAGLATALYTTIGGLCVFLLGQGFLIAWREWTAFRERAADELLGEVRS